MIAGEPHVRRRGFFLHSSTDEPDTGEYENPEGFVVRVRVKRTPASRHPAGARVVAGTRPGTGRSRTENRTTSDETQPAIRSGSVTGSRQRSH